MKKSILTIVLLIISTFLFAQAKQNTVRSSSDKISAKTLTATPDSLLVINLTTQQVKTLLDVLKSSQQLLSRSPDISAYQASEIQKAINEIGVAISKQVPSQSKGSDTSRSSANPKQ